MWATIAGLLLAPLVAMRFTSEVDWDAADFALAGALLIGAGAIHEIATLKVRRERYRALIGAALAGAVLLVWAQAAVGVF